MRTLARAHALLHASVASAAVAACPERTARRRRPHRASPWRTCSRFARSPAVSRSRSRPPDAGSRTSLTDMDDEWNVQEGRPTGHVLVQALGAGKPGAPRALTTGAVHSSFPVWSPDGRRLAFIREEKGTGRAVIWDAERDQMTPVGDPFTARIMLAPQWDPSGKTRDRCRRAAASAPCAPYRVRSVKSTRRAHPRRSVLHRRRGTARRSIRPIDVSRAARRRR